MVMSKSFTLTVDGKSYKVDVPSPGMISVDGNVFPIEITGNGVKVNGSNLVSSLSEGFAIVAGKLYETELKTE
ncbi:MAG: hypothetical protein JW934_19945 [Anaerolineae bacterium]|nr:hypothetical protein [Anaerolineae bacterium]